MTQRLRNKWEKESLKTFIDIYLRQWRRTQRVINQAERDELRQLVADLYRGEPAAVRLEVQKLFDDIIEDVAIATLRELTGPPPDPDIFQDAMLQLAARNAALFSSQISENSLRLSYSVIDDWLQTPGSTVQDLTARMERIWRGPRPAAAATTETTRLLAETRIETFKQYGAWGFKVQTRNDDRVRPEHVQYAADGPYPLDRTDRLPPFGDVNCRCTITAVMFDPNEVN